MDKVALLKIELCTRSTLYVDHMVDHRDALLLFEVLR